MGKFLAEAIAEFSAGLRYDAIPEAVRDAAMLHIVDTIGVDGGPIGRVGAHTLEQVLLE